eukprot:791699-Prymnesium_polylepis.1
MAAAGSAKAVRLATPASRAVGGGAVGSHWARVEALTADSDSDSECESAAPVKGREVASGVAAAAGWDEDGGEAMEGEAE